MVSSARFHRFALLFVLVIAVASCSSSKDDPNAQVERSAEILYNEGADLMDQGDYKEATDSFNEVERQHPYSQWATRAQLMAAYGYYKAQDYDQADLTLDRFIKLHPGHKDVDYAYYLKALCFYEQISDIGRDQAMTKLALENLDILTRRFPNSKYARDAMLKRDLTLDHLAGKEMEIGRYYLIRGHYVAAINRFREVVRTYQTTTHTPEALHRMVEAYMSLGIRQEAVRVAAVLGYNYPGSVWYEDSYTLMDDKERARLVSGQGFVDRTMGSLFRSQQSSAEERAEDKAEADAEAAEADAVEAMENAEDAAAPLSQDVPSAGVNFVPTNDGSGAAMVEKGQAPAPDMADTLPDSTE